MNEKTLKFNNVRLNKKEKSKEPIDLMSVDKSISFLIKDDKVWEKYEPIWDVIINKLGIKFHSFYDKTYIKAKVREFEGVIKTNFLGNVVPKKKCIILALLALLLILL